MKTNTDLNNRFHEVLRSRAARLGVKEEDVEASLRAVPRSSAALRAAAIEQGLSPDELLEQAIQTAVRSDYPTPLCLKPSELDAYLTPGALPSEVLAHVADCVGCQSLLAMVRQVPPPVRITTEEAVMEPHGLLARMLR